MKSIYRICLSTFILSCINIGKINSQTTYSFNPCGATGQFGPTQAQVNAMYLPTNLNGSVVISTQGVQNFTIPTTSNYSIVAAGAGGGAAQVNGGRGRILSGIINLPAGTVLKIVVGQKGVCTNTANQSSGGGGGSYVTYANNTPIIVGGGGAGFLNTLGVVQPLSDANYGNNGNNSACGTGVGGVGGNGGTGTFNGWGGGAGGLNGNGTNASACFNTGGMAFINGSNAGGTCNNTTGGFGGGGGTHGNTGGGGGGGGYSGGGGSNQNIGNNTGGGGGSYQSPSMNTLVNIGLNLNQGYVYIIQNCAPGGTPLDVTPVSNHTVCPGGTGTLSASGTGTLNWYATNVSTLVLGTGTTFVTPTLTPGSYSFWASASNTCSAGPRTPITLTVTAGPTITVAGGAICPGNSFTMSPSGAVTYTYSSGIPVVSPTTTTIYTITGTDPSGCVSTPGATVQVFVSPFPTITVNSGTICAGQQFTMFPGGASSYTYQGGSPVVTPTANATYTVIGTNTAGCVSLVPAVASITVFAIPSVTMTGPSALCIGQTVTLSAFGALTYSWSSGPTSQSIVITPTSNISYSVVGTGGGGCGSNAAVKNITVNPNPTVSINVTNTLICKFESLVLTGSGADTYSWSTGSLNGSISITPMNTTSYTVLGTNTLTGCNKTATINIVVTPCTGISQNANNITQIMLYPNPNNGEFVITINADASASVYNVLGEVVLRKKLAEGENQIDMKSFAEGIYYIKIKNAEFSKTLKMIKE